MSIDQGINCGSGQPVIARLYSSGYWIKTHWCVAVIFRTRGFKVIYYIFEVPSLLWISKNNAQYHANPGIPLNNSFTVMLVLQSLELKIVPSHQKLSS